jgi:hypothetical protein
MMRTVAVVALLFAMASVSRAQTLADVARAEEARRKAVAKTAKVYTNDDLKADFTTAVTPAPAPPAAASGGAAPATGAPGAAGAQGAAPTQADAATGAAAAPVRDQAYWSARIAEARSATERSRMFADALQSRINALTTDFVNRDDPAQRAVIEQDRLKALSELERVKKEIEANDKAVADILEEARRAGVPPGWLR